jgi:hypothetical protein
MLKKTSAVLAVLLTSSMAALAEPVRIPEPAQTMITGRSDLKSVYETSYTSHMRTTLTRENKYPDRYSGEVSAFFDHAEYLNLEQDRYGIGGRYGVLENMTVGAEIPFVDSEFYGESESGLGDVVLSLDLLAYQDIFRYPFVIPHVDVALPTGDEDKGLGAGDAVINFGISVGTKVYDALTYVIDFSYAYNGAGYFVTDLDENIYMISGSLVWDISDRLAFLVEGRLYEKLDMMMDNPFEAKGGMAYRFGRQSQLALYGGVVDGGMGEDFDQASVQFTLGF